LGIAQSVPEVELRGRLRGATERLLDELAMSALVPTDDARELSQLPVRIERAERIGVKGLLKTLELEREGEDFGVLCGGRRGGGEARQPPDQDPADDDPGPCEQRSPGKLSPRAEPRRT
jgi:hypothetical protein